MTLRVECDGDGCTRTVEAERYGHTDWLVVESESEPVGHFCSWTCLANFAMRGAMEHESVPMPMDDGTGA